MGEAPKKPSLLHSQWFAVLIALLVIGAPFAILALQQSDYSIEEDARERLAMHLKDSDSARFRNVRWMTSKSMCGEVNAKNGFGAYAGYSTFYISGDVVWIDDDDMQLASTMCD